MIGCTNGRQHGCAQLVRLSRGCLKDLPGLSFPALLLIPVLPIPFAAAG